MDPVLKYCAVGRQLGYAMYLSLDAVTYVSAIRISAIGDGRKLMVVIISLTLLGSGRWRARRGYSRRLTGRGSLG